MINKEYRDLVTILFITAFGAYLRFYNLGELSLWSNEDYLAISVRAIMEHGIPVFPSEILYPRAIPLSYITAGFVKLLGFSEFTLRLPAAIFSTLTIPLTYIFTRQITGRFVALIAASLISVFLWEIYMAHTARMYAMFSFALLSTLVLIHAAEIEEKHQLRGLAIGTLVLTALLHQLSVALLLILLAYIPYFIFRDKNPRKLVLYILVLIVTVGFNRIVETNYYDQWEAISTKIEFVDIGQNTDLIYRIKQVALPLYIRLFESYPAYKYILMAISTISLLSILYCLFRTGPKRLFYIATVATILALSFQQIILATMIWLFYLLSSAWLKQEFNWRYSILAAALIGTAAVFWVGLAMISSEDISIPGLKSALKLTFSYPPLFLRLIFDTYPWLTISVLITGLYILINTLKEKNIGSAAFLLLAFFIPILAIGFHPLALERMYERYVYFLNPYFIIIVAYGISESTRCARDHWSKGNAKTAVSLVAMIAIVITLSGGASFSRSYAFVQSEHGENRNIFDNWLGKYQFRPDYKTPSLYVAKSYKEGDLIIAMDILAHYAYFPKADFQLTVAKKRDAEGWIGAQIIDSTEKLKSVLDLYSQRRIWILTSSLYMKTFATNIEFQNITAMINSRAGDAKFVGRDHLSSVFCIGCEN